MIQFLPRASFGLGMCGTLPVSANACRSFIPVATGHCRFTSAHEMTWRVQPYGIEGCKRGGTIYSQLN